LSENAHNYNLDLDAVITEIKEEFKNILIKREQLVLKLGKALENMGPQEKENICAEIKGTLREEIAQGLISRRDIERYCPDEWKQKTKPKRRRTTICRSPNRSKKPTHNC